MELFRKLWVARKLILVVMIPLSLLPLPLIHPSSVSTLKSDAALVNLHYECFNVEYPRLKINRKYHRKQI